MTRKDYAIIAAAISRTALDELSRRRIIQSFVEALSRTNSNFDAYKFAGACGFKSLDTIDRSQENGTR